MKIDFYIAGIQKSGTTNLASILTKSSNIYTHQQLECTFFHDTDEYKEGAQYLKKNYFFHVHENFKNSHYCLIKHSGTFTCVDTFKRVINHSPHVQFLLVFRNPIQRFVSSYLMEKTRSLYPYDLKTAIDISISDKNSIEHKIFYSYGEYDKWSKSIFAQIDEKKIHIFLFEELYNDVEHHLENFAKKYNLNINTNVLNQLSIQNSHKEYKHHWYQKIVVKLKQQKQLKKQIKKIIPSKHWIALTKKNRTY